MKKQKRFNKIKFGYYVRKLLASYGLINIGSFIAVWLMCGFSLDIIVGLVLAILLILVAVWGNKCEEDEM